MPAVWFALKKSLECKSEPSQVHEPRRVGDDNLRNIVTKKAGRSGCSKSISNLKDVIHGSKRHLEKPAIYSPRSIGSSELLNPITHEVVLSNSTCELKITGFGALHHDSGGDPIVTRGASNFKGTLKLGTPGPRGHHIVHHNRPKNMATPPRRTTGGSAVYGGGRGIDSNTTGGSAVYGGGRGIDSNPKAALETDSYGGSILICHKCGDQFKKLENLEAHHLCKHAVTELVEGDSSRNIVEIICQTSGLRSENNCGRIERVLKVHSMQKTLARFEEYRETVKIKASKLPKKHPRCLADGNELLRFYGTTVACSLGMNGSSGLCLSNKCGACQILRHGFPTKKEHNGAIGVFTTSTSGSAFESIELCEQTQGLKKALIVCRVIAGRVHRPLENHQELDGQSGFDSFAGKIGLYSNIEELYLLSPRALLPCFVVICK